MSQTGYRFETMGPLTSLAFRAAIALSIEYQPLGPHSTVELDPKDPEHFRHWKGGQLTARHRPGRFKRSNK